MSDCSHLDRGGTRKHFCKINEQFILPVCRTKSYPVLNAVLELSRQERQTQKGGGGYERGGGTRAGGGGWLRRGLSFGLAMLGSEKRKRKKSVYAANRCFMNSAFYYIFERAVYTHMRVCECVRARARACTCVKDSRFIWGTKSSN